MALVIAHHRDRHVGAVLFRRHENAFHRALLGRRDFALKRSGGGIRNGRTGNNECSRAQEQDILNPFIASSWSPGMAERPLAACSRARILRQRPGSVNPEPAVGAGCKRPFPSWAGNRNRTSLTLAGMIDFTPVLDLGFALICPAPELGFRPFALVEQFHRAFDIVGSQPYSAARLRAASRASPRASAVMRMCKARLR